MTIDPDVARIAKQFGSDPALIQAVVRQEGGGDRIIRAVQCSVPSVTTREQAIEVLCRSANHRMSEFVKEHAGAAYVDYFASKWAPVGVANDPKGLNQFWAANVTQLWLGK